MSRRATRLVVLVVLALVAAGCSSVSSTPRERGDGPLLTAERCADLVVIGARGSTQNPHGNFGVGTEVAMSVQRLAARVRDRSDATIRIEAVDYDSARATTLDAYQANVAEGAAMLADRLARLQRDCPGSRFAMVGFSQGAQVVHEASTDVPRRVARRVRLVAMIADPLHNSSDDIEHWGYASEPVPGDGSLGAGAPIDADLRRAAISLCVAGDEICNARGAPSGPHSTTHKRFYEKPSSVRATARRLDDVLRRNGV